MSGPPLFCPCSLLWNTLAHLRSVFVRGGSNSWWCINSNFEPLIKTYLVKEKDLVVRAGIISTVQHFCLQWSRNIPELLYCLHVDLAMRLLLQRFLSICTALSHVKSSSLQLCIFFCPPYCQTANMKGMFCFS